MDFLKDTEGTVLFPLQTEITFISAIFTTAKRLAVSVRGHIGQKQYWSACLCFLLLVAYVGVSAAVVWAVIPWLEALIVSKLAISAYWAWPVKRLLFWSIGKMVKAICRKYSLAD
ncbi:abortive infection protein [Cronobacter dublinensis]|uniref:abortive infection protein n=1 Tax=Cronobacter dublinensis TaxID=413497 RepID=UPI00300E499A